MSILIVAAYVSVRSLLQVLDNPTCRRLSPNTIWFQTLHEKVTFLIQYLENYSGTNDGEDIEDLAKQIAEVVNEAESIIDFHVVDLLRDEYMDKYKLNEGSGGDYDICIEPLSFCQEMDKVIEKIDSIQKTLLTNMVKDHKEVVEEKLPSICLPTAGSISVPLPSGANNTAIGLDDHVVRIMDLLTGKQTGLQIIPIVGMGGIGKTTLARNVFDNKLVVQHFDVRIWFTVSQVYSVHETLIQVLHDVTGVPTGDLKSETLGELGKQLHQNLFGKRYLIVMDDLWSTRAWDEFKYFFSDNDSESRIMVTTRMLDVADYVGSCKPYGMKLLDDDQSWNLLCEKVFGQASCSTNLEGIGKRIAKGCRGLPLALVAIGGLLAKSDMTEDYWEFVARNVNSFVNSENDDNCLKVLHLSYNHLPIHLKPCFLYMSVFPEDHEVRVSKLIKLWIAEGFLKPIIGRVWEDVAQEYLKDLIDRNLIFIRKQGKTGKVKTCGIHDILRDLCLRESRNKPLFGIPKVQRIDLYDDSENKCVLCGEGVQQEEMIHIPKIHVNSRTTASFGVVACKGCSIMYSNSSSRLRVVRVVLVTHKLRYVELLQPTKLRYLSLRCSQAMLYPGLHLLWNLETLNINMGNLDGTIVPSEIWEMKQLRHIILRRYGCFKLPDPVEVSDQIDRRRDVSSILENLQTISYIHNFESTEALLKRIPNLKKLGIIYRVRKKDEDEYWSKYSLSNKLVNLQKLESLSLECSWGTYPLGEIAFPYSLKKLELIGGRVSWKKMSIIGKLTNLQVLKLEDNAFIGREWNPIEGEFLKLKFLSIIYQSDWERWGAEDIHFPVLQTLLLTHARSLEGIPSGIGDIPTLRLIDLHGCKDSFVKSAKEIIKEQHNCGNEDLQLYIDCKRYETNNDF